MTYPQCGTYAGWNVHRRQGEPPCDPCKTARNEYTTAWRLRTGRTRNLRKRPSRGLLKQLAAAGDRR